MKLEEEIKQGRFNNIYEKTFVNIIYTSSWLEGISTTFFKSYKITPQQYNILRILRGQFPTPSSVNLLIERMLNKMSNASRLVDKLLIKGLVERKINVKDKRQVDIIISKKGLELLGTLDNDIKLIHKRLHSITSSEAIELNRLLDKLRG